MEFARRTAVGPVFNSQSCAGVPLQSKLKVSEYKLLEVLQALSAFYTHLDRRSVGADVSPHFEALVGSCVGMQHSLRKGRGNKSENGEIGELHCQ